MIKAHDGSTVAFFNQRAARVPHAALTSCPLLTTTCEASFFFFFFFPSIQLPSNISLLSKITFEAFSAETRRLDWGFFFFFFLPLAMQKSAHLNFKTRGCAMIKFSDRLGMFQRHCGSAIRCFVPLIVVHNLLHTLKTAARANNRRHHCCYLSGKKKEKSKVLYIQRYFADFFFSRRRLLQIIF